MNKNTKVRLRTHRKACKKSGWPTPIYKKKKKNYPKIGEPLSLDSQNKMFLGASYISRN